MDRASALQFLHEYAAALRLRSLAYTATSKTRLGLVAQAVAIERYAARIEAAPTEDPGTSVFLLLI